MATRSDKHRKRPKTQVIKYSHIDYPPYEAPIYVEDDPNEKEKLAAKQKRDEKLISKTPKYKKAYASDDYIEPEIEKDTQEEIINDESPHEEKKEQSYTHDDNNDDYIYKPSLWETITSQPLYIGGAIASILIIGAISYALLSPSKPSPSSDEPGTTITNPSGETVGSLKNKTVSDELKQTKEALIQIQGYLNNIYLYNTFAEGTITSEIINTETREKLTAQDKLFEELGHDPAKNMSNTPKNAFKSDAVALYTQSFLKYEVSQTDIDNAKNSFERLVIPERAELEKSENNNALVGYDDIVDAAKNIELQLKALDLKLDIERRINELTLSPIYITPSVDSSVGIKDEVSESTLSLLEKDIQRLLSVDATQELVTIAYTNALDIIKKQNQQVIDANDAIDEAVDTITDASIKKAESAINKLKSADLRTLLNLKLANTKDTLAKNKELDQAIKKNDELREKLEKEYANKISELNEKHKTEIDTLTKTKDADYTKKVQDMTEEKNQAVQAARSEMQTEVNRLQNENAELQQSNTTLQNEIQRLQDQLNQ